MTAPVRAPYPGLRAFRRSESDLFFGRDGCVDEMVDRLAEIRFLAVLGASGSGKSSLVRTGLMDALELGFHVQAGSEWLVADMHPGADPMAELAGQLLKAKDGEHQPLDRQLLADLLRRGPLSLAEWCRAGHLAADQNLLVLVDQFEELFRYSDYGERETAEAFVEMLLESASTDKAPISIIITMRSEYLSACTLFSGLAERINKGLYLTPRMSRDECREAIIGPAAVCGFSVTGGLANRLLNDMESFAPWEEAAETDQVERLSRRADQLPLMQHVLNLMWLRERETPGAVELTEADYEALGGLKGALDEHGDQLLAQLGPDLAGTVETMFRALVVGSSPSTAVRRPTVMAELAELAHGDADGVARVVELFRGNDCNFLQPPSRIPLTETTIVDLSHESLIRQWSKLAEWTAAQARSADYWQRLAAAAERHAGGEGELLHGLDLAMFAAWWDKEQPSAAWARRNGGDFERTAGFLAASRALHDEAERARLAAEVREKRGLRRRAALWGGVALLTTASTAVAAMMWGRAETAAHEAQTHRSKAVAAAHDAQRQKAAADVSAKVALDAKDVAEAAKTEAERQQAIATSHLQAQLRAQRNLLAQTKRAAAAERDRARSDALAKVATERTASAERQNQETQTRLTALMSWADRNLTPEQKVEVASISGLQRSDASAGSAGGTLVAISGSGNAGASQEDRGGRPTMSASPVSGSDTSSQPIDAATLAEARMSIASGPNAAERERAAAGYHRLAGSYDAALRKAQAVGARIGRAEADEYVRLADEFAWFNLEIEESERADQVVDTLKRVAGRLPQSLAATAIVARTSALYLDAERSYRNGDEAGAKVLELEADRLAGQVAADPEASQAALRIVFRIKRYMARLAGKDLPLRRKRVAEACAIADRLTGARTDGRAIRLKGRCLVEQAGLADAEGRSQDAVRYYTESAGLAQQALQSAPTDQWLHSGVMDVALNLSWLLDRGGNPPPPTTNAEQRDRWRRVGVEALVQGFGGQPLEAANGILIRDSYDEMARLEFADRAAEIRFFARIGQVMTPVADAFPRSAFGYVTADARRRVGEALARDPPEKEAAQRFFELADGGYRRGEFLQGLARYYSRVPLPTFSELPAAVCGTSQRLATLLGKAGQVDQAVAVHQRLLTECRPALDAYPFDFYLRMTTLRSYADVGAALAAAGRAAEAASYLEHASHWGHGDATKQLAALYQDGKGVPADRARATSLRTLAQGQTMKRFTVPTDFNGVKFPFYVYVRAWPAEYATTLKLPGVEDQARWVKEARGGEIPKDVRDSFIKLQQIATENNVSFPDLTEYALAAAADLTATATRADSDAIAAAIRRERFSRSAAIDSDSAGVALKGYDPVSYRGGRAESGSPRIFALWNGAIWLFASDSNRQRFLADPARFAPAFGGYCATCLAGGDRTSGDPLIFAIVDGQLLLFSNQERRQQWLDAPSKHLEAATRRWDQLRRDEAKPATYTKLGRMIAEALAPN